MFKQSGYTDKELWRMVFRVCMEVVIFMGLLLTVVLHPWTLWIFVPVYLVRIVLFFIWLCRD